MSQKLFFLYLKTGGGHLSPAKSVAQWINKSHPDKFDVQLIDGFEGVKPIVKLIIEDGYRKSQEKARWVFESLYAINKIKPFAHLSGWLVSKYIKPVLEKRILVEKPDKIVIFHFFLIKPINQILKKNNLKIPVLTVVTDPFTAHPIWFLDKNQQFIVFSQQLKKHLVETKGVLPDRIHTFPFILNEKYSTKLDEESKNTFKDKLKIPNDSKVLLIMGGGDGIPKGVKILNHLLKTKSKTHIILVCGNNKNLFNSAHKLKQKYNADKLSIFGFVDFIYDLLNISDLVITKCGASTFMEVLMCGKIPIVNSYIWEQEKGNVEFICNNNLGYYEKKVKRIPFLTEKMLTNLNCLNLHQDNIRRIGLINGTPQVSEFILNFT